MEPENQNSYNVYDNIVSESNQQPVEKVAEPIIIQAKPDTESTLQQVNALKTNSGRQISDSEEEEQIRVTKTVPNYMRGTRASIALSSEITRDKEEKTHLSKTNSRRLSTAPISTSSELPHYMQLTQSHAKHIVREDIAPKKHVIKPVDSSNIPRYMNVTVACKNEPKLVDEKKRAVVKEVDKNNLPRYMQPTKAHQTKVETDKPVTPARCNPSLIKPVDTNNIPRYMKDTVAWRMKQSKDVEKKVRSPKAIKPVDTAELPRYMMDTRASMKKPEEEKKKPMSLVSIKEIDKNNIPHYLQSTNSLFASNRAVEQERKEKEALRKVKTEEEGFLAKQKERWEQQRKDVDEKLYHS